MFKIPCEIATKSLIPTIRALLAIELTKSFGMTQSEAASLLGITQSAISRYAHHERGTILRKEIEKEDELKTLLTQSATSIANDDLSTTEVVLQICNLCKVTRGKGLMCELCERIGPTTTTKQCKVCFTSER